jgi:putative membrane protein
MDRRLVLTGFAALAAGPALAQQQPLTAPIPSSTRPAETAGAGGQGMGQADQQWLQQTMMAGAAALQTSQIALEKAEDDDVKSFAKFEVDEQKGIAEVLHSLMEPSTTASTTPPMPKLEGKHAEMVQKMQQMKAGEAFDREYIKGQVEGHRELLQIQETFLKTNPGNREAMNIAKLARGHIREHLAVLDDYT